MQYRDKFPRTAVPSFFTLMNLFCGFLAITQIHDGQFIHACYLIVLAGFFDLLDGMVARLAQGQSLFGVELDSLSDVVSFGVAPSFLVYAFALGDFGVIGLIVSALPAMCASVRLARYNVTFADSTGDYFSGLPAPIHAFILVTFVLTASAPDNWMVQRGLLDETVLFSVVFILGALMVTNVAFDGAPMPTASYLAAKPLESAAYSASIVLIVLLRESGLLISLFAYVFTGIVRAVWRGIRTATRQNVPEEDFTNPL